MAGVTLALAVHIRTLRSGPPLREHAALRPVLPFFMVAFGSPWFAVAASLLAASEAALTDSVLLSGGLHSATLLIALYGFLVPVSVAM